MLTADSDDLCRKAYESAYGWLVLTKFDRIWIFAEFLKF